MKQALVIKIVAIQCYLLRVHHMFHWHAIVLTESRNGNVTVKFNTLTTYSINV